MQIAVVGAAGKSGGLVTAAALSRGHEVVAIARRPEAVTSRHDRLTIKAADVLDQISFAGVFDGVDAVISTLGIGTSKEPTEVYSKGIANVIAAAPRVPIAVISASPAGPPTDHRGFQRRVVVPILWRFVAGTSYADMRRMEAILADSDAAWISLRPPRLLDKPGKGSYQLDPKPNGSSIRYADLATALIDVLDKPELYRSALYISN
jgi:putative NADH-flavin reductase